jgi:Xaa-Pro aminopeptidase
MNHAARIKKLRSAMRRQAVEAMWITHLPDVRYLCGFTGSNAILLLTARKAVMYTDGRYIAQAKQEVQGTRVVIAHKSVVNEAAAWMVEECTHAAFDPANTTVAELEAFRAALPAARRRSFFRPAKGLQVLDLRLTKDEDELQLMQQAAKLGCRLFEMILPHITSDATEMEVAAGLEFFARSLGAEAMSFDTIVASGKRSAMPHGHATLAKLPRNGFVTLDFGVILKGYCSDMTRTVHLGRATRAEQYAYEAVLAAQQAAVDAVRPGITCGEIDEAARSVLRQAKLADYFTHSTGHGVGIEIHEPPRVGAGQETELEPGMVITIEPGVYMPEKFGIRIEDMVAVTAGGGEVLTPVTKAWMEL